jgi:hypothetical protein
VSSWMSGMVGALCKKVVLGLNGLLWDNGRRGLN